MPAEKLSRHSRCGPYLPLSGRSRTGEALATFIAHDGLEGIEKFREVAPDVVLLDIGLPKMSGYEVAERIRPIGPKVKSIAVTRYGGTQDRERATRAGFDSHLVKPVDFEKLERLL